MKISKVFTSPTSSDATSFPVAPSLIAEGAMVMAPTGSVLIEELEVGDRIVTYDRGVAIVSERHTVITPTKGLLAPIVIDSCGCGTVSVSPPTLLMVRSPLCQLFYGSSTALVRAASLRDDSLIRTSDLNEGCFVALCLEQPGLIYVNGMLLEAASPLETKRGIQMRRNFSSHHLILGDEEARCLYKHAGGAINVLMFANW